MMIGCEVTAVVVAVCEQTYVTTQLDGSATRLFFVGKMCADANPEKPCDGPFPAVLVRHSRICTQSGHYHEIA
jgi:hypothetical protein